MGSPQAQCLPLQRPPHSSLRREKEEACAGRCGASQARGASERPYVLQFVLPSQPDAGAVVLLLDAAVEVRARSSQARRGLPGAAFQPHLLEAVVRGSREPLVLPDVHPDMTRRWPARATAGSGGRGRRERGSWPGRSGSCRLRRASGSGSGSTCPGGVRPEEGGAVRRVGWRGGREKDVAGSLPMGGAVPPNAAVARGEPTHRLPRS